MGIKAATSRLLSGKFARIVSCTTIFGGPSVGLCIYFSASVCVCVCVCARARAWKQEVIP